MAQKELRPGEDEAIGGLLRGMAPVAEAPPEVRERIRAAVAAEWRTTVATGKAPARRWQRPALALAAGFAVAAVAIGVLRQSPPPVAPAFATLARFSGAVEAGAGQDWQPVTAGQSLAVGQQLVTGPEGRAALALARDVTLRLDGDTRISLAAADRVVIERGAVYLDSGLRPGAGPPLSLDSRFGTTRHLGTQYEVRVLPATLEVSVREGQVETRPATGGAVAVVARAGEQVVLAPDGRHERRTIDRRDPRWDWIAEVTPPYAIEDRPLAEFLAWVCRETGRDLAFADPGAEAAARDLTLRGSIAGLAPDQALAAVMATTALTYQDRDGRLIVQQAAAR